MSVTAAPGFVAAGCHAGIKFAKHDMALIATEDRKPATAVAVFTQNKFVAPPVVLDRERLAANGGTASAIIVNSGNANAGTGDAGMADAEAMTQAAAEALGIDKQQVLVSSTGIIGTPLPMEKILGAVPGSRPACRPLAAATPLWESSPPIMCRRKRVVKGSTFTVGGMAKGCGMIAPNMATMLAYLTTDADVPRDNLQRILKDAADRTFNTLNVDGATSTNDTVILLANGRAGPPDVAEFADAVHRVCEELTLQMARDAEGMTKMVMLQVTGAASRCGSPRRREGDRREQSRQMLLVRLAIPIGAGCSARPARQASPSMRSGRRSPMAASPCRAAASRSITTATRSPRTWRTSGSRSRSISAPGPAARG